jgi:hypothetical protein
MKIMTQDTSATARAEKPHVLQTTRTNTIIDALKRRAQAVLNDETIDAQSRAVLRYALETNDPWLAKLVRRADAGETIIDEDGYLETPESGETDSSEEKIQALAEMICRSGNQSSAALFVLMAKLENAAHPKTIANSVKHFAFNCCGELNLCGIVDAQVEVLERELLARNSL